MEREGPGWMDALVMVEEERRVRLWNGRSVNLDEMRRLLARYDVQERLREEHGCARLIGVDEAGAGAWAGPVFAGAVSFRCNSDPFYVFRGLHDSKKLSESRRNAVYQMLASEKSAEVVEYQVREVDHITIDKINILRARFEAMTHAILGLAPCLDDLLIVDGPSFQPSQTLPCRTLTVVEADQQIPAVSAASIIAKVCRDRWMVEIAHEQWPMYGFKDHKGYGTKKHSIALKEYGPCPIHRMSYKPVANAARAHG